LARPPQRSAIRVIFPPRQPVALASSCRRCGQREKPVHSGKVAQVRLAPYSRSGWKTVLQAAPAQPGYL
jgi:hypothetical protein